MIAGTGFSSVTEFIVSVMQTLASGGEIKQRISSETVEVMAENIKEIGETEEGKLKGDHHENAFLITVNLDYGINQPQDVFYAIRQEFLSQIAFS